jgi:hypothetical protein
MIPRYATPTKSSRLYTYTNRDQDLVKLGFRAGNFTFLKKFPQRIKPFAVTDSLKEHSRKNLLKTPRSVSVKRTEGYSWMPDNFNRKTEIERKVRADSVHRRRSISKRDFISSGSPSRHTNRTQSTYVSINSSYSSVEDQTARLKWINNAQIRQASFKSGRPLPATKSFSSADEIIKALKLRIAQDWKSSNFNIGLNANKCIELRVFLNSIENLDSMTYYVNTLINKTPEFLKYCLKKVPAKWGVKVNQYLVFTLAPGWVNLPSIPKKLLLPRVSVHKSLNLQRMGLISTRNSSLSIH